MKSHPLIFPNADRRARYLISIQAVWMATLLVLAAWWGTLLHQQIDQIATLETQLGLNQHEVQMKLDRGTRMVIGESLFFIAMILIVNGVLIYLFVRDHRRSKSIQAFFASITHELRTPLTSVRLQAETIHDLAPPSEATPFLDRLLEDVERLEGQVQQTLELARLEGGGQLVVQQLPIVSFLKNKIEGARNRISKRLEIELDTSQMSTDFELSRVILADTHALNMIIRNIFDNAIKYSSEPIAKITIRVREVSSKIIQIYFHHRNANFTAKPETLGNLFYRGPNSQGAGVGLYLIRTLMQRMNGSAQFLTDQGFSVVCEFRIDE